MSKKPRYSFDQQKALIDACSALNPLPTEVDHGSIIDTFAKAIPALKESGLFRDQEQRLCGKTIQEKVNSILTKINEGKMVYPTGISTATKEEFLHNANRLSRPRIEQKERRDFASKETKFKNEIKQMTEIWTKARMMKIVSVKRALYANKVLSSMKMEQCFSDGNMKWPDAVLWNFEEDKPMYPDLTDPDLPNEKANESPKKDTSDEQFLQAMQEMLEKRAREKNDISREMLELKKRKLSSSTCSICDCRIQRSELLQYKVKFSDNCPACNHPLMYHP